MDRDYDGRLSFAELMGEETPIEKLFKLMDKNGDGFVSKRVSIIYYIILLLHYILYIIPLTLVINIFCGPKTRHEIRSNPSTDRFLGVQNFCKIE